MDLKGDDRVNQGLEGPNYPALLYFVTGNSTATKDDKALELVSE